MFLFYIVVIIFLFMLKHQTTKTLSFTATLLKPFPQVFSDRLLLLLGSFISGISMTVKSLHIFAILFLSILIWIFCVFPVDFILQGFGINLPITASVFIMVLLVFAVMVPASPGFIGTYHYACYKGLSVFGIAETTAVSIALIVHGTTFFPVIFAGFYHLWREGLTLNSLGDMTRNKINETP